MDTKKIVITGGPSTGKTVVIQSLEEKGFLCLHEVIRSMTLEKKEKESHLAFKTNPIVSVSDPQEFNQRILDARIAQYTSFEQNAEEMVFFDRGIPDVLAYMSCFDQKYSTQFEKACADHRYDLVFLMPPWKEIHISDNERFETYDESLLINDCLLKTYRLFGYNVRIVPKDNVPKRVDFILDTINSTT